MPKAYKSVLADFQAFQKKKQKGAKGDQGDQGLQGSPGLQGPKGDRGPKGEKGDQGERGLDGTPGREGTPGLPPEHRWDGTKLSFQQPNGTWGEYVDLRGKKGEDGKTPNIPNIPKAFSASIDAVKGLRAILNELQEGGMQYDKLIDTVGDYKYIGEANPGTKQSQADWRIKRIDMSNDAVEDYEIVFADGTKEFTKVWDDRLTYDYTVEA